MTGSVKTGKSTYAMKIQGNKVDKNLEYNPSKTGTFFSSQIGFEKKKNLN